MLQVFPVWSFCNSGLKEMNCMYAHFVDFFLCERQWWEAVMCKLCVLTFIFIFWQIVFNMAASRTNIVNQQLMYACLWVWVHVWLCVCVCLCMCVLCMCVRVRACVCVCVVMLTYIHVYMWMCVHACVDVWECLCLCECMLWVSVTRHVSSVQTYQTPQAASWTLCPSWKIWTRKM